jgi:hypothetical protein
VKKVWRQICKESSHNFRAEGEDVRVPSQSVIGEKTLTAEFSVAVGAASFSGRERQAIRIIGVKPQGRVLGPSDPWVPA